MKEAEELLEKYKAGLCTPEEVQLLQKWFHHLGENEVSELSAEDLIAAKLKFEYHIRGSILPERSYQLWPKIAVTAAAVAAVVFGVWFFSSKYDMNKEPGNEVTVNDIAPGRNGATLTLANGKVIALSDSKSGVVVKGGDLKYNDGSDVRYSSGSRSSGPASPGQKTTGPVGVHSLTPSELQGAEGKEDIGLQGAAGRGQNLMASTAKGQTYQFTLPDGTKVWLNADSKISFPVKFSGTERRILLSGEGYFEVAKDKVHPFIVKTGALNGRTGAQEIEVLGTHFNVSAYGDDQVTTTTLVEGSVKVSAFDAIAGRQAAVLKPNEQSVQNARSRMQVRRVDVSEALDWKNGEFIFSDNENIVNIMRRVSRWYDVEVSYVGDMADVNFTGSISRAKNISAILKLMEGTKQVRFKIEGRKVIAEKGK